MLNNGTTASASSEISDDKEQIKEKSNESEKEKKLKLSDMHVVTFENGTSLILNELVFKRANLTSISFGTANSIEFIGGSLGERNIDHLQFRKSVSISGNPFEQYACENDGCKCAPGYRNTLPDDSTFISCRRA